jgi:transaldolase
MKIFIDTAKLREINEALSWGIVDGVTTNPTLLREAIEEEKEKSREVNVESYIGEICRAVGKSKHVSLEVLSQKASGMVKEAQMLYKKFNPIAGNVAIKIPVNTSTSPETSDYEGLRTIKELSKGGIPVNATLVMTPEQGLLAAKAGAAYVSPFAGRVDDFIRKNLGIRFEKNDYFDFNLVREIVVEKLSKRLRKSSTNKVSSLYFDLRKIGETLENDGIRSGTELVKKTVEILRKYGIKTKVIAASMRNPRQVREVAEAGADIATIPFDVLQAMLKHPKTKEGVKKFFADATRVGYEELFCGSKRRRIVE